MASNSTWKRPSKSSQGNSQSSNQDQSIPVTSPSRLNQAQLIPNASVRRNQPSSANRPADGLTPRQQVHQQQQRATVGFSTSEICGLERGSLGTATRFGAECVPPENLRDRNSAQASTTTNSVLGGDTMARRQPVPPLPLESEQNSASDESSEMEVAIRDEYLPTDRSWLRHRRQNQPSSASQSGVTSMLPGAADQAPVQQQDGGSDQATLSVEPTIACQSAIQDNTPTAPPVEEAVQLNLPPRFPFTGPARFGDGSGDWNPRFGGMLPPILRSNIGPVQQGEPVSVGTHPLPGARGDLPASMTPQYIRPPFPGNMRHPFPGVPVPRMQGMRMRASAVQPVAPMPPNGTVGMQGQRSQMQPPRMAPSVCLPLERGPQLDVQSDGSSMPLCRIEGQQGHPSKLRQEVPFLQPHDINPQLRGLIAAQYAQQRPPAVHPGGTFRQPASSHLRPMHVPRIAMQRAAAFVPLRAPLQTYPPPYMYPQYGMYYGPQPSPGPQTAPNPYYMMGVDQQGGMLHPPPYQPPSGMYRPSLFDSSPVVPEEPRRERNPSEHTIPDNDYLELMAQQAEEVLQMRTMAQESLPNQYIREGRTEPTKADYSIILPAPPSSIVEDVTPVVTIPDRYLGFLFYEANFGRPGAYMGPDNVHRGVMRCLKQPVGGAVVFFKGDCADIVKYTGNDQLGGARRSRLAISDRMPNGPHPPKNNSYMTFNNLEDAQSFARSLCSEGCHARLIEEPVLDDCNIFVHNLPNVMTICDLLVTASPIGVVDEVCVGPSKFGVAKFNAFFRMATAADARQAILFFDRRLMQGYNCEIVAVAGYRFTPNASVHLKISMVDYRMEFLGYVRNNVSNVYGANRAGPSPSPENRRSGGNRGHRRKHHHRPHHHHRHHRHHQHDSEDGDISGRRHDARQSPNVDYSEAITQGLVLVPRGSIGSLEQPVDSDDETDESPARFILPPRLDDGRRSDSVEPPQIASAIAAARLRASCASPHVPNCASIGAPQQCSLNVGHGICACAQCMRQTERFLAATRERVDEALNRSNLPRADSVELDVGLLPGSNNLDPAVLEMLKLALMPVGGPPVAPVRRVGSFQQGSQALTMEQIEGLLNIASASASQQQAEGLTRLLAPNVKMPTSSVAADGQSPSVGPSVRTAGATKVSPNASDQPQPLDTSIQNARIAAHNVQAARESAETGSPTSFYRMQPQAIRHVPQEPESVPFPQRQLFSSQMTSRAYAESQHQQVATQQTAGYQQLFQAMSASPNQQQAASQLGPQRTVFDQFDGPRPSRQMAIQYQEQQRFGPSIQSQPWPINPYRLQGHPPGPRPVSQAGNGTVQSPRPTYRFGPPVAVFNVSNREPSVAAISSMANQHVNHQQEQHQQQHQGANFQMAQNNFLPHPVDGAPLASVSRPHYSTRPLSGQPAYGDDNLFQQQQQNHDQGTNFQTGQTNYRPHRFNEALPASVSRPRYSYGPLPAQQLDVLSPAPMGFSPEQEHCVSHLNNDGRGNRTTITRQRQPAVTPPAASPSSQSVTENQPTSITTMLGADAHAGVHGMSANPDNPNKSKEDVEQSTSDNGGCMEQGDAPTAPQA